jgi:hypothetical protein
MGSEIRKTDEYRAILAGLRDTAETQKNVVVTKVRSEPERAQYEAGVYDGLTQAIRYLEEQ